MMLNNCDICKLEFPLLDKHHIISISRGGSNDKYNITEVCPNCHREIHLGLIVIDKWYLSTNGYVLIYERDVPIDESCYIIGKH